MFQGDGNLVPSRYFEMKSGTYPAYKLGRGKWGRAIMNEPLHLHSPNPTAGSGRIKSVRRAIYLSHFSGRENI